MNIQTTTIMGLSDITNLLENSFVVTLFFVHTLPHTCYKGKKNQIAIHKTAIADDMTRVCKI